MYYFVLSYSGLSKLFAWASVIICRFLRVLWWNSEMLPFSPNNLTCPTTHYIRHPHLTGGSLSTQTLLAPGSKSLRILQDYRKVVCSCSTPIYNGYYKTNFWIPNLPPYILKHNVEMTALICKIIVSIVASAHELRYNHTKF